MIYLDYNATAPIRPGVLKAMEALGGLPLNPSSVHSAGRHAKKLLEDARATIASALSAFPNEVMFVGSATEANTTVLRGFPDRALLVSAVEHASITKTGALLGAATIPVDHNGIVKLDALEQQLKALGKPALVSVMLANNETGVIQPIAEIARIAHAYGALVHCDAVQALGKITLDWGLLGVDMLTLCAHKAGGPVGVGALLIRADLPIKPLFVGGKQELGRRASTDNVHGIVGLAQTVSETAPCREAAQWLEWREYLENEILTTAPEAVIFGTSGAAGATLSPCGRGSSAARGEGALSLPPNLSAPSSKPSPAGGEGFPPAPASPQRLPQTLCISMPGVKSETQLMNFDLAGFAVSAGSACSSGRVAASGTLIAMGIAPELAESAIRISWGWATTRDEIEAFAAEWKKIYSRLTKKQAA